MEKVLIICSLFLVLSCSKEKELGNMVVQGKIKGLKKGSLYLQKIKDTTLVSVDSIHLYGRENFTLTDNISSPQMYYLYLAGNENKVAFFAEPGTISINNKLDGFGSSPIIEGSKNQKIMEQYQEIAKKFQEKQLDLLAKNIQAQKEEDLAGSLAIRKQSEQQNIKKYVYTINFALNHTDSEAAAYIALTELVNANVKYLDSIYNTLSKSVQQSLYGKELADFIHLIKETE